MLVTCVFSDHRYIGNWSEVKHCTRIKKTYCDLTGLIHDYRASYKVRVQRVAEDDKTQWMSQRRFSLTDSKQFSLWWEFSVEWLNNCILSDSV